MWIKRIMLFVGGLFVMSLGVGISIKSGLGVTPISSIPYSLTLASGANIGITTIIFNAILVFLQIPILKKRFKCKKAFAINQYQLCSGILQIFHCGFYLRCRACLWMLTYHC